MKQKYIFKILSIFLLTLFLYSCGMQSNGVFEKRKHLKGWHFHQKKRIPISSSDTPSNKKIDHRKSTKESEATLLSPTQNEESQIIPFKKYLQNDSDKIPAIDSEKPNQKVVIQSNDKRSLELEEGGFKPKEEILKTRDLGQDLGQDFNESIFDNDKNSRDSVTSREPRPFKKDKKPFIKNPFQIIISILGLWFLLGIATAILAVILLPLLLAGALAIAIPLMIIGYYVLWSFFVYFILRLFIRVDGDEIWTLKETFLYVGMYFFISALIVYGVLAIGYN